MHDSVKGRLEDILRDDALVPEMDDHLRSCAECRGEVEAMRAQSRMFAALKAPAGVDPGGAFYARVMNRIEAQAKPSPWSLFGESLFARRLVYASATLLVLFGSYLISSPHPEDEFASADSPEVILAGQEMPAPITMEQKDRDVVLVNLATWGGGAEGQDYQ